jgi:hypothetical protein
MQRQIHEFKQTGRIPVDSLIKIGESVISFLVALFNSKRSKEERLNHIEQILVQQQAEIDELKGLVSEINLRK